jgi:serine protease AprX
MDFYNLLLPRRRLAALFVCLLVAVAVWVGLKATASVYAQEIEPAATAVAAINELLARDLEQAATPVSFLVVLRDQADATAVLANAGLQAAAAQDRRAALYRVLTAHAEETQAPLRAWLDARGVRYTPHYLANMIEVEGDQELAAQLRLRPEVDRLARNPSVRQTEALARTRAVQFPAAAPSQMPYGLAYTKADQAWALGIRGQGVVVASQDTGVKWDHPALRSAYRGWDAQTQTAAHVYNWFDAFGRNSVDVDLYRCSPDPQVPCDDGSHGTHTVGTMVGDAAPEGGAVIGMAPAAEWVGCRNMRGGAGTPASYTTCFEWFLAPYPQGGNPFSSGRPDLAPGIINNSWGCPPREGCDTDTLRQIVDTVRAAGLFVAASAGNEAALSSPFGSSQCNTVSTPIAIYDSAFSIGAHDQSGNIAYFSSRGPVSVDGSYRLKPDLTAPGVSVLSTIPGGYGFLSGTSMASPHVAAAVALLWSVAPELAGDIDRTEAILRESATPVINGDCDPAPISPNNVYGYGRLDVMQSILHARPPATATIVVAGSPPVASLPVRLVYNQTGFVYTATTGADGKVQLPSTASSQPLLSGEYTVQVPQCLGFVDTQQVTLLPHQETQVTITAPPAICRYLPQLAK